MFCEGPTEQAFCAQLLQPHLFPAGDGVVHTLAVGRKNDHHVYGLGSRARYDRLRKFMFNTIRQRDGRNVYFTTLLDLYGLPLDFPGLADTVRNPADPTPYVLALEAAFGRDIDHHRFVPYLQLHEYETMLFADPAAFAIAFENCDPVIAQLNAVAAGFPSVEHIDDGRESAPSKRIIAVVPEYKGRKTTAGPDIAEFIGLPRIREACPHVHGWLTRLESLLWDAG